LVVSGTDQHVARFCNTAVDLQYPSFVLGMTATEMALTVLKVVGNNDDKLSLQHELTDLCGCDMLSGIMEIITHREELLSSFEVS